MDWPAPYAAGMAKIASRRCDGCGLPVNGDSLSIHAGVFHRSCALSEPDSQDEVEERSYRSMLKRLAHWGNSLGWGQG